jgi:ADP-heptose:LPS heptosyltransferase
MKNKTFRVIAGGGLGDVLLTTPAFAALKKKYRNCRIIVYCASKAHRVVLEHNPYIDRLTIFSATHSPIPYLLSRFRFGFKLYRFLTPNYGLTAPSLFVNQGAARIIAELFDVKLESSKIQVYLTEAESEWARGKISAYKRPIIIHISSRSSKNEEWPLDYWEELIRIMPDYTFLQVGLADEPQVKGAIDLRGKTTFRQAMALVKYALSFAGVNSSFSHVTNAFGIRGVVLFGPSNPEVWGQENNINLYKKWRCAPCIDLLYGSNCPYSKPCMKQISPEEVKRALLRQISGDRAGCQTYIPLQQGIKSLHS